MKDSSICIIGAGSWGTALAILLADKFDRVDLWSYDDGHAGELNETRRNESYLPGVLLPANIYPTSDISQASASQMIAMVTPSKAVRETAGKLAESGLQDGTAIISCTKGIEFETGMRMSGIISQVLPGHSVAALSGPSHAEEVARGVPAAVVVASEDNDLAIRCQNIFATRAFRTYSSSDIVGVELGGALKNIYALAAGIGDGLGLGDNSKAALVTRSLAELMRLGTAMGGDTETFMGLSGIGDLMVTCFSNHSRNRGFGERLGKGESLEAIRDSMKMVAEGVPTTRSAFACAGRLGIRTPVIDVIHAILEDGKKPEAAMQELMSRELKAE